MARMKKPESETEQEAVIRRQLEAVSNSSNRSEKTSWNRKMDNMVKLIAKLRPIELKMIDLHAEKLPILDDIEALRSLMTKECVHPYDQLAYKDDHIVCKFCGNTIRLPDVGV